MTTSLAMYDSDGVQTGARSSTESPLGEEEEAGRGEPRSLVQQAGQVEEPSQPKGGSHLLCFATMLHTFTLSNSCFICKINA